MASTPAPLPSLGLLDGLGTAGTGNTDTPAPLPSLALLGGLGTAAVVVEEPPLAWVQERIPDAWYVDPGFSAAYAWHQHGILVANRDEVAELVGNQGGDPAPLPHLGLLLAQNAGITINGSVGSAAAAGILAGLSLDIEVAGVVGGATAAGVSGTVSLSGSGTGATAAEIWSYVLSNGKTAEQTLVAVHTWLSELHLIHGLTAGSPLSVTAASRAAGAVSQAVAEAAGTVTVTRQ